MFRISVIDGRAQRRMVLEGRLAVRSVPELKAALKAAKQGLDGRELVVDLKNLVAIDEEGKKTILDVMNDGNTLAWVTQRAAEAARHQAVGI
jgi:anti-anti-sigma regulatory factor